MKIAIFADKIVGLEVIKYIVENYRNILKCVVLIDKNNIYEYLLSKKFEELIILNEDLKNIVIINKLKDIKLDYIILAWWPYIIKKDIYQIPKIGTINFHPSLLPFNRGKHPNFWTIVEETPFGVTLHFVDDTIDGGDILFQRKIDKSWEDTGESLYFKSLNAILELFYESFPKLMEGNFQRIKQDLRKGTFHRAIEIDQASLIEIDKEYKARHLLNLLRARTFKGYPACYFYDEGEKYEVRIEIKKVNKKDE